MSSPDSSSPSLPAPSFSHSSSHSLQSAKLEIVYHQLNFTVRIPSPAVSGTKSNGETTDKVIIHSLNGRFRPGKFTAIMGSSGSGNKGSMTNE
jgi:hypothetical protein